MRAASSTTRRVYAKRAIAGITEADVERLLANMASDIATLDAAELRDFLKARIGRIVMDAESLNGRIHYEIPAETGDKLASPRGFEPRLPP